jgi:hypothetical protein
VRRSGIAITVTVLLMILAQSPRSLFCQNEDLGNASPPTVSPAADGIFAAFQRRPIVALSDVHGMAQEEDFYALLVRDKRFPDAVGNVVVEFGDAAQQTTLDRYLAGDAIPYEDLRKVWSDTVGWIPTVDAVGYASFFAHVRAVNLGLPADKRIRVWLGDPPIDWSKIVRQNFEYWYEPDFSDGPEQLNENGDLFQVLFVRGDRRTLGPAKFSLREAVASAEELVTGQITWTTICDRSSSVAVTIPSHRPSEAYPWTAQLPVTRPESLPAQFRLNIEQITR